MSAGRTAPSHMVRSRVDTPRRTRLGVAAASLGAAALLSSCAGSVLDSPSENPLPTTTPAVEITQVAPPTTEPILAPRVYIVASGDTLSGLADRFGTTSDEIIEINDLANPDSLAVGDELLIPAPENPVE